MAKGNKGKGNKTAEKAVPAASAKAEKKASTRTNASKRDYNREDILAEGLKGKVFLVIKLASSVGKAKGFPGVTADIKANAKKRKKATDEVAIVNKINSRTHYYKTDKDKRGSYWKMDDEKFQKVRAAAKAAQAQLADEQFGGAAANLINTLFEVTKTERKVGEGTGRTAGPKLTAMVKDFDL